MLLYSHHTKAQCLNALMRQDNDLQRLAIPVMDVTRSTGKAIIDVYTHDIGICQKPDNSPLCAADLVAHQ